MSQSPLALWGESWAFPLGFLMAAFGTVLVVGRIIPELRKLQLGQRVRDDGPRRHLTKTGTPTMGGSGMIVVLAFVTLVFLPRHPAIVAGTMTTVILGVLGFFDDYLKISRNRPLGLKGRVKIIVELACGAALAAYFAYGLGRGTEVLGPRAWFVWDLGAFYPVFGALVMAGTANAVNLTDGLDGLAAGAVALVTPVFILAAMATGDVAVALWGVILLGVGVGFLWHNFHPATVFMGDTGALALGGALAFLAMYTGTGLILVIAGGLFVVETVSVMAQVIYFHLTGGRRLLKMAPLHHHLELSGLSETATVLVLWAVAGLCSLVGVWALGGILL
ncbi:MAG: phospho-N-acetylmuramoyl-pentapeptide-transferase [Clostridia bacterium]